MNKKQDVFQLIENIRERPGMYIGECSIIRLRAFVYGYAYAIYEIGLGMDIFQLLKDFNDYIQKSYHIESTEGWDKILLSKCNNDEEKAFKLFGKKWDDFLAKHK